eukprot:TRINITY_DN4361_c0_g1_i1.p1 TRINITY_DN4361_c0_g1~~TRINITY_DN4361_c0_g1_i1.p1  ORF type:complete len:320 (-),score=80.32 TRINITY_DN4361_c0_g1_i1:341-1270(-)
MERSLRKISLLRSMLGEHYGKEADQEISEKYFKNTKGNSKSACKQARKQRFDSVGEEQKRICILKEEITNAVDGEPVAVPVSEIPQTSAYEGLHAKLEAKLEAMRASRGSSSKPQVKHKTKNQKLKREKKKRPNKILAPEEPKSKRSIVSQKEIQKMNASSDPKIDQMGQMDFSSLDFGSDLTEPVPRKRKNLHGLLERAKRHSEKLNEMKNTTEGKDQIRSEQLDAALLRTLGEKLSDKAKFADVKLINKRIKRIEKKKMKSRSDWADRKAQVETKKESRISRREENISLQHEQRVKAMKLARNILPE